MITWRLKARNASNGVWEDLRQYHDEHSYQKMDHIYHRCITDTALVPTENRRYNAYALFRTEEIEVWVEEI